jgi:hemerythrin-like domain-containing protein
MKCTDLLIQDHKIILAALDVLDHLAERIGNDLPVEAQDVEALLHFLRTFADDHHQTKEESALFPELMRTPAGCEARLRQIIFEHDQERSLVEGLEDALRTKKGAEFVHFANRLTALIRTHIRKEDTILFEIAERCLSAEQDERVAEGLEKFQIDPSIVADLRRLESTYLKKAA